MKESQVSQQPEFSSLPKPVRRVGVIGGGQLAWMMAEGAAKLGLDLIVQTPHSTDPAVAIATDTILAPIADASATAQMAFQCDVITFENEFVDLDALHQLAQQGVCFCPSLDALQPLLDKYDQRSYLQQIGLPTPQFAAFQPADAAQTLTPTPTQPAVLKTRRHGYDGQGTFIVKTPEELQSTLTYLSGVPLLIEEFVPFERELAVMAARSVSGEVVVYPVVETQQQHQVCRWVLAPAAVDPAITTQVEAIARQLLTSLHVVGIFGIEFFLTIDGKVLVNEVAPRTHNSGHYTLDACETSQFEQQLRAISGLPLGSPALRSAGAVMVNLLGYETATSDYQLQRDRLAAIPRARVHWYGKTESRSGRKLGHVTVLLNETSLNESSLNGQNSEQREQAMAIVQTVESIWYG